MDSRTALKERTDRVFEELLTAFNSPFGLWETSPREQKSPAEKHNPSDSNQFQLSSPRPAKPRFSLSLSGTPSSNSSANPCPEISARISASTTVQTDERPLCQFYLKGKCRFRERCHFSHELSHCHHCGTELPLSKISASAHLSRCYKRINEDQASRPVRSLTDPNEDADPASSLFMTLPSQVH